MKSDRLLKPLVFAFIAAVLTYVVAYNLIEHRRVRRGPWQVTFTNDVAGVPMLVVSQPALGITNAQIAFPRATLASALQTPTSLTFDQPRAVPYDLPYGTCIFMDTTFLPGTIVFQVFGHEVQLIPRVLTIDGKEMPWRSGETISISGSRTNAMRWPVRRGRQAVPARAV